MFLSKTAFEKSQKDAVREESMNKAVLSRRKKETSREKILHEDQVPDGDDYDKIKYKPIRLSLEKVMKDNDSETKKPE